HPWEYLPYGSWATNRLKLMAELRFLSVCNCNVPPNRRRECGYSGIPRFTCLRRGCCFNNSIRNTICQVPSCFVNIPSTQQCAVQPKARVNCGYPYISAQTCHSRGCCFDSSIPGVIWCFFPGSDSACRYC
uniref:P-type domain-containing protein n=1 Tax=Podarcis muralis TaxID=64176 RepID=A0A670KEG3_PODMU